MEVSPSLTVVHITEDRIGTNTCQFPCFVVKLSWFLCAAP
jgi:hypothetical protein